MDWAEGRQEETGTRKVQSGLDIVPLSLSGGFEK
jgi:hypothetical protein